jgi:hypothetical protein
MQRSWQEIASVACMFAFSLVLSCVQDFHAEAGADSAITRDAGCGNVKEQNCENQDLLMKYDLCNGSTDPALCSQNGGTWSTTHFGWEHCLCETGQRDCSCCKWTQCNAGCFFDLGPNGLNDCDDQRVGKCSPDNWMSGCRCFFDENGHSSYVCYD